ncbi:alanine racemase [uncultured Holdemanella sp.]|uniref:alanine racemase n=1 Tax=uncultured Holdemanella sp. TaxID=1763549 RepID=UPI00280619D9|nr:alanine racemase [uncultured Holdemanella sp.]
MLEAYSRAWTEIDYDAIAHNVEEVRKLVKKTKIMGIVKANAYGLGDVACARALQKCGVDYFGVSSVDEALNLRNAGIQDNILILGYTPSMHFHYLHEQNIVQSLVSIEYARELNQYAKDNGIKIRCHCKVDTGMCRTGIVYQKQDKHIEDIYEEYRMENLCVEGIFSHFPVSDCLDKDCTEFTTQQIHLFDEVVDLLKKQGIDPGIRHIQNSYGILNYPELEYEYCRPGLLYMGVTSDDHIDIKTNPDFIPIMSMYANISLVKWIYPGQSVSYGRHFVAEKPTKVATMSIGYADGLPRLLSNQGFEVLVHGKRCKLIGNLCMDQCMIDVTDVEDVKEGDVVCIVGHQGNEVVTVDQISRTAKTINNETLTSISSRVPRLKVRS